MFTPNLKEMEKNHKNGGRNGSPYSTIFAKQVISELVREGLTSAEAAQKHGVSKTTIKVWRKKYSSELSALASPTPMTEEEKTTLASLQAHVQELEKVIAMAQLKISALEISIDLAEQEFQIDIRKKSGSRQSKS